MNSLLIHMARNNLWSNYRLYKTCCELSEKQYRANRPSYFGSIHATLNHILIVDLIYIGRLNSKTLVPPDCEELESDIQQLANRQKQVDREMITFLETQNTESINSNVSFCRENGQVYNESVINILMHLFTHQIHHRGQVHNMLCQTSIAPPQLDEFFLDGDLDLRACELNKLDLPLE